MFFFARSAALLGLAVAALLHATPVRAQTADTTAITTALRTACPGSLVRVATRTDGVVQGRCGTVQDGRLLVRAAGGERGVELVQIDTVWLRQRSTGRGAAIGAVVGGLGLGLLGLSAGHGLCEQPNGCGREPYTIAGVGALVGLLGGTVIGGIAGYHVTTWDRRHPR